MAKKIIVLGSGYSGSGAIYDYLSGRADCISALEGNEFRLLIDPGGIIDLHAAIKSFYINSACDAVDRFLKLAHQLGRPKRYIPPSVGKNYRSLIPGYDQMICEFIDEISASKFRSKALYRNMRSPIRWLENGIRRKLSLTKKYDIAHVPVTEKEFMIAARKLISKAFRFASLPEEKRLIVNQGGSIWKPLSSTEYYGAERKVICVFRNPKDQFVELRRFKGMADAKVFAGWYSALINHLDEGEYIDKTRVLPVIFDSFVQNFDAEKEKIDSFVGLEGSVSSAYDRQCSLANVEQYKKFLTNEELILIKDLKVPTVCT